MTDLLAVPVPDPALRRLAAAGAEPGAADHDLVCARVQHVTRDTKTFSFAPVQHRLFRHEPGQYLAFTFEIGGEEVNRCYTISSPPSRPHLAAITVKRVPGGRVSNWLHDHLTEGGVVRARGPLGRFSMVRHPAPGYLFLSGGSGITPLMSMVRTLYDLASPADVVFLHSARSPDDIPFRRELELIAATAPNIRVSHVCEADGASERWRGYRGRLRPDILRQAVPDVRQREVFTCGPAGYMRSARRTLSALGLPESHYHEESFLAPDSAGGSAVTDPAAGETPTFTVELSRSRTTIECDARTPVLEAAARAGLTLPSSCGQGMCGTCLTTLEKGSVNMCHNGGLRPRDEARNKILLCCSTPLENLVIDA